MKKELEDANELIEVMKKKGENIIVLYDCMKVPKGIH
jgi:hypothetical protein